MSKHHSDYDGDCGDEEYDDTMEYVHLVRKALKNIKISDNEIINKLEDNNYDIDDTTAYFKGRATKATAKAPKSGAKASPNTAGKGTAAAKSASNLSTTSAGKKPCSNLAVKKGQDMELSSVFRVEHQHVPSQQQHQVRGDLIMSDDEDVLTASAASTADSDPARCKASGENADVVHTNSAQVHATDSLTLVVTGHVDAGKSTLLGNLLYKCGQVGQRTIHKYAKESAAAGKASFGLAWVTDECTAEREHGVTIGLAERYSSDVNDVERGEVAILRGGHLLLPLLSSLACFLH